MLQSHETMGKVPTNTKDYFLTQESFGLSFNSTYQCYQTDPIPVDLEKYYESEAYISHTDGKKGLFESLYQLAKNFTLANKRQLVRQLFLGKTDLKVLDIGCGTGDFLKALPSTYSKFGIEPNDSARILASQKNITCKPSDLDIEDQFDLISMWHVLEHVPDLEKQFKTFDRLLKKDGKIIIAVPNHESFDATYYGKFWAAYDVPRHVWHFSKTSIKTISDLHGYSIEKISPMWLDSIYVSMLSEKYKKSNLGFVKGIFVGFLSNILALRKKDTSSLIYILKKDK